LWTKLGGGWYFNDYTYTAVNGKAVITSPDPSAPFAVANLTFTWTAGAGATAYWLDVGTSVGGSEIFSQNMGLTRTQAVTVPGGWIFVRLWTQLAGKWQFDDYVYSRTDFAPSKAQVYAPRPADVLGPLVQFLWGSIPDAAEYWLQVGTAPGLGDLFSSSVGLSTFRAVFGIPATGNKVYARLWTRSDGGAWQFADSVYYAASSSAPVTFASAGANGSAMTTYSESGFDLNVRSASWTFANTVGQPAPSVEFVSPIGTTTTGEILITSAGAPFHFNSIEVGATSIPFPYEITATGPSGIVFRFTGYAPAPYGFLRVTNPFAADLVDQVSIKLTNQSNPYFANAIRVDNIDVSH
jgi:hypothetical protein